MNNACENSVDLEKVLINETKDYLSVISDYLGEYNPDEREEIRQEILVQLKEITRQETVVEGAYPKMIMAAMCQFGSPYAIGQNLRKVRRVELGYRNPLRWVVWPFIVKQAGKLPFVFLTGWLTSLLPQKYVTFDAWAYFIQIASLLCVIDIIDRAGRNIVEWSSQAVGRW